MIIARAIFFYLAVGGINASASEHSGGNSLLIRAVTIIDGTGAQPTAPLDVEVIGNRITRIGQNLKSKASVVIDGTGKTLIPGLIDCHVHIRTVPGALFRDENPEAIREQQIFQLKSYLAAGVTTILDAATPGPLFDEVARISRTYPVPRFLGLAPFLTPKNGYFASEESRRRFYSDLSKPVEKISEIRDRIEEAQKYHPFGLKTTIEYGFAPFATFPVFDSTYRAAIRTEAARANLPVMVHTEAEKAFWLALDLKPYAFMHGGFFDKPATQDIVQKIAESKAYVVSTLAIYKMMLLMWDQNLFEDPWFQRLVPPEQIKTAQEVTSSVVKLLAVQNKPWFVPRFIAEWLSGFFIRRGAIQQNYENSKISLKSMYDHGVPIVMGSDAGNYPLFSTFFHGVGSILEVEALLDAGIPPLEVIHISTSRAAEMLKINKDVGTVAEGKIADLVLLNQSPLTSSKAFRDIALVIKDGQLLRNSITKRPPGTYE